MGCPSKATSVQHAARAHSPFLPAASTWYVQNADEWLSLAAQPEFRVDRSDRESMCEPRFRRDRLGISSINLVCEAALGCYSADLKRRVTPSSFAKESQIDVTVLPLVETSSRVSVTSSCMVAIMIPSKIGRRCWRNCHRLRQSQMEGWL